MGKEILVRGPDGSSRRIALEGTRLSFGRSRTNEICFPEDVSLSRSHFVLEREGDDWSIQDLGSKNGTHVDGVRLSERRRLAPGDRIEAGQVVLIYDPTESPDASVQFYPSEESGALPQGTVMTSLKGLLSSMPTSPLVAPSPAAPVPSLFSQPAVAALLRVGKELGGQRPLAELFQLILDLSIDAVGAERAILLTLEGDSLVTRAIHGEGFRISSAVRDRVVRTGASLLVTDVQHDESWSARQSISEQQVRTMMAAPLQTEDRVIGMIYLDSRLFVRAFTPDDLNLLTVLANVAAVRIEQERLREVEEAERIMSRDLAQAAEIQRLFIPRAAPGVAGFELAGHNVACRTVGGDYYDFLTRADGKLAAVLGDVSGKGMPAALMMTGLQSMVQALWEEAFDLPRAMSRLDRFVAERSPSNRFVSLFFAVLDPATADLSYCNAGHNPPFLVRADGTLERLAGGGTVLGILPEIGYEGMRARLGPGDLIVVYSDGVTEMTNREDEEFGEERFAEVLLENRRKSAREILDAVNGAVEAWAAGTPSADDVTLVVIRRAD